MANWKQVPAPQAAPEPAEEAVEVGLLPDLGSFAVLGHEIPLAAALLPLPILGIAAIFLLAGARQKPPRRTRLPGDDDV